MSGGADGEPVQGPFSATVVAAVLAIGIAGFFAFLVLLAYAPDPGTDGRGGGNAMSRSAIGFAGAVDLLRSQGVRVAISRVAHGAKPRLLVLTPPASAGPVPDGFLADAGATVLVVLPKWLTRPDPGHQGWVLEAGMVDPAAISAILPAPLGLSRRSGREAPVLRQGSGRLGDLGELRLGLVERLQTLGANPDWTPLLIDEAGGVVLARRARPGTPGVVLLSDPDLLDDQGLADIAGARAASRIIDAAREGGDVAFDVTLDGLGRSRNLLRLMFEPPILGATLCAAASALLVLLASHRFGPAVTRPRALDFGKRVLADNAAAMVALAGIEARMARPYAELMRALAIRALGAPPRLDREAMDAFLDRAAAARALTETWAALERDVEGVDDAPSLVRAARRLADWSGRMRVDVSEIEAMAGAIRAEVAKAVVGQAQAVDFLLTAALCGGHVLLEGPPGTAKTFLLRCFSRTLQAAFGRVQFTPDLMPGDIVGSNIFDFRTSAFALSRGPVFCDVLLADEINRAPPKTQAALLEAMQERQVTIDGVSHGLGDRFMVVATQNPIENQGTYPLPEAQLDRFLFKHVLGYPSLQEEVAIVRDHGRRTGTADPAAFGVAAVAGAQWLSQAVAAVAALRLADEVVDYVVRIVRATRESPDLEAGASPRSGAMLAMASRARAAIEGRDYVIPDDVRALALPVLRHRLVLSPVAEIDGRRPEAIVASLLAGVPAPR